MNPPAARSVAEFGTLNSHAPGRTEGEGEGILVCVCHARACSIFSGTLENSLYKTNICPYFDHLLRPFVFDLRLVLKCPIFRVTTHFQISTYEIVRFRSGNINESENKICKYTSMSCMRTRETTPNAGSEIPDAKCAKTEHVVQIDRLCDWRIKEEDRLALPHGLPLIVTHMETEAKVYDFKALPNLLVMGKEHTVSPKDKYVVFIMALRGCLMQIPQMVNEFMKLHELQTAVYSFLENRTVRDMFNGGETERLGEWIRTGACVLYDVCVVLHAVERDGGFHSMTKIRQQTLHLQMLEFETQSAMADSNDVDFFKSPSWKLASVLGEENRIGRSRVRKRRRAMIRYTVCLRTRSAVMCAIIFGNLCELLWKDMKRQTA